MFEALFTINYKALLNKITNPLKCALKGFSRLIKVDEDAWFSFFPTMNALIISLHAKIKL